MLTHQPARLVARTGAMLQPLVSAFVPSLPKPVSQKIVPKRSSPKFVAAFEGLTGAAVGHAVLPAVAPKVRDVVPADAARTPLATIDATAARLVAHTAATSKVVDDRADPLRVHDLDVAGEAVAVAAVAVANEECLGT